MVSIDFDKLLEAFEFANFDASPDSNAYVDRETGHIYWVAAEMEEFEEVPDDIDTSDRYLMLPDKRDLELGRNLVFAFTEEALPDEYEKVVNYFRKQGAYARFKDLLDRHDALTQWHEFEAKQTEMALREWCQQNAIQLADPPQA